MAGMEASRKEMFLRGEKDYLRYLPERRFVMKEQKLMTVGRNSYVSLFKHYYSVPKEHVGRHVTMLYYADTVEIYCGMSLVATTLIMCIAAHEMKRLGLVHKPMIIGLKANVAEIAECYRTAYPNARILYASEKDFAAVNRVRFFNNIRNIDWDCVIMSHDQFGKIPQSPEMQQKILQAELDTVEENPEVLKQQGKDISRAMLKGLEVRKHNLAPKLQSVAYAIEHRTDDVVDYGQMGIDHIFVDESHYHNF